MPEALQEPSPKGKPIYIDCEKGRRSVVGFIQRGEVDLIKVDTFKDAETAIFKILRNLDLKTGTWKGPGPRPTCVVIDGMTALGSKTIQDVVLENPTSLWDSRKRLKAERLAWGEMSGLMIRLHRFCRALNIPLILTAAERARTDEETNVTTYFPDFNPAVINEFVYGADTVLRVYRTAGKRVVRCQPNDHYFAKIRVPDHLPPAPEIIASDDKANSWASVIKELNSVTGGLFTPLDESGEISPVLLYGMSGVGKTRLAVELALSL